MKAQNSMEEVDVSFSKGSAKNSVEDVENINSKYEMRPDATCMVIKSRGDLEKIANIVSPNIAKSLIEVYERGATGCAFSNINYVFIFRENNRSKKEEEITWWHEQTHCVFRKLKYPQLEELAKKALSWVKNNSPEKYAVIKKYYNQEDELSEAVSVFIEDQIENDGTEFFLTTEYFDNEELTILASLIKESIKNGTEKINERIRNGEFNAQPRNAEYGMREDSSLRQHNESGLYGRTMGELPSGSEGTAEELQQQRLAAAEQKVANAKGVAELANAIAERERIKNEGVSSFRKWLRRAIKTDYSMKRKLPSLLRSDETRRLSAKG